MISKWRQSVSAIRKRSVIASQAPYRHIFMSDRVGSHSPPPLIDGHSYGRDLQCADVVGAEALSAVWGMREAFAFTPMRLMVFAAFAKKLIGAAISAFLRAKWRNAAGAATCQPRDRQSAHCSAP